MNRIAHYLRVKMVGKEDSLNIAQLPFMNQSHVRMRDPKRVEAMLNDLLQGGLAKLQVVTDFDFTLTKQRMENGEVVLTSFGMFEKCASLPKDYITEARKLYEKYRPIEIDPHLTLDEKLPYMIEWWTASGDLLK